MAAEFCRRAPVVLIGLDRFINLFLHTDLYESSPHPISKDVFNIRMFPSMPRSLQSTQLKCYKMMAVPMLTYATENWTTN
jgi:hypothetical protein